MLELIEKDPWRNKPNLGQVWKLVIENQFEEKDQEKKQKECDQLGEKLQ